MWIFGSKTIRNRYKTLIKLIMSIDSHFLVTEDEKDSFHLHLPNYKGNQTMDFDIYLLEPYLFISFVTEIEGEKISCVNHFHKDANQQDMFNTAMANNLDKVHQVLNKKHTEEGKEKDEKKANNKIVSIYHGIEITEEQRNALFYFIHELGTPPYYYGDTKTSTTILRLEQKQLGLEDGQLLYILSGPLTRRNEYLESLKTIKDMNVFNLFLLSCVTLIDSSDTGAAPANLYSILEKIGITEEELKERISKIEPTPVEHFYDKEPPSFLKDLLHDEKEIIQGNEIIAIGEEEEIDFSDKEIDFSDDLIESQFEELNTIVTENDLNNAWTDEYGVQYSSDGEKLLRITQSLDSYIVKDGTKVICDDAFNAIGFDKYSLKRIVLPETIVSIGGLAFAYNEGLMSINIPQSVKFIKEENPFSCCFNLHTVKWDNDNYIKEGILIYDSLYKKLISCLSWQYIDDNITNVWSLSDFAKEFGPKASVGEFSKKGTGNTFKGCAFHDGKGGSITAVHFDDKLGVMSINEIFAQKEDLSVVQSISGKYFLCKSFDPQIVSTSTIDLPSGLEEIAREAFACNNMVDKICIPESVNCIGEEAFRSCRNLISINIPNRLTQLREGVFSECSSLTNITLPDSLAIIEDNSFFNCNNLESIIIPSKVKRIGENVFSGCTNLRSIVVDEGNNYYDSRNNCNAIIETNSNTLVVGCSTTIIPKNVVKIGNYAFAGSSINEIIIPEGIKEIGNNAFEACDIKQLKLPNGVVKIGSSAFVYCNNLVSITIPNSVESIDNDPPNSFLNVFRSCNSLKFIFIEKGSKAKFERLLPNYEDKLVEQDKEVERNKEESVGMQILEQFGNAIGRKVNTTRHLLLLQQLLNNSLFIFKHPSDKSNLPSFMWNEEGLYLGYDPVVIYTIPFLWIRTIAQRNVGKFDEVMDLLNREFPNFVIDHLDATSIVQGITHNGFCGFEPQFDININIELLKKFYIDSVSLKEFIHFFGNNINISKQDLLPSQTNKVCIPSASNSLNIIISEMVDDVRKGNLVNK